MTATFAFYAFSAIMLVSAGMVVSARNPVHSVLFLILAFFNAAALFLLAGAEFLAMILVIVYVGAVAVLFLFVVMMLDINFAQLREGFKRYRPIGATIGVVLLAELSITLSGWKMFPGAANFRFAPSDIPVENTAQLGQLLYTDYLLPFQAAGLILLVAMIGAIVLTLRDRREMGAAGRRQSIAVQVARRGVETMELVDVARGAGVDASSIRRPKLPEAEPAVETTEAHGGHH